MKTLLTVGNIMKLVTELPVAVQLSSAERDAVLFGDYHRDPKVIEAFEHAETIIFKTFDLFRDFRKSGFCPQFIDCCICNTPCDGTVRCPVETEALNRFVSRTPAILLTEKEVGLYA